MTEKKSIEELRAEAEKLRKIKAEKDERAALEAEVKNLKVATGQISLKKKALIMGLKGLKSVAATVQSDLDGTWQENEKKKKAKVNGQAKS